MSAVAEIEKEVSQLKEQEVFNFVMPRPSVGQNIIYYPSGRKAGGEVASVFRIGGRNIIVQRMGGMCIESVRHLTDPKLELSEDQRETGAWDFTDFDKKGVENEKLLAALAQRVTALEELLDKPSKK